MTAGVSIASDIDWYAAGPDRANTAGSNRTMTIFTSMRSYNRSVDTHRNSVDSDRVNTVGDYTTT